MTNVQIVDDEDPNISYNGGWQPWGAITSTAVEYNSTLHRGYAVGQSFSYTFTGIGVTVYGSLNAPAKNGMPGVEFSVDSLLPTPINETGLLKWNPKAIISHQPFWSSPVLPLATHNLTVNITKASATGPFVYFDFLTIDTGEENTSGYIIVDDTYENTIKYTGNWSKTGIEVEYQNSASLPLANDSSATINFTGTQIYVYGTRRDEQPTIGFELDGETSPMFLEPNSASQFHTLFYQNTSLQPTNHTLKMTNLSNHIWTLDYFIYTNTTSSIISTSPLSSPDGKKVNTTEIIAGVIGGLAVVGLILLVGYWIRVRERRRINVNDIHLLASPPSTPSDNQSMRLDHPFNLNLVPYRPQPESYPTLQHHSKAGLFLHSSLNSHPHLASDHALYAPSAITDSTILQSGVLLTSPSVRFTETNALQNSHTEALSDIIPPPAYSEVRTK